MAVNYKRYLAENVLSERRVVRIIHTHAIVKILTAGQVTYRLLSRALKVHSNLAKQSVDSHLEAEELRLLM